MFARGTSHIPAVQTAAHAALYGQTHNARAADAGEQFRRRSHAHGVPVVSDKQLSKRLPQDRPAGRRIVGDEACEFWDDGTPKRGSRQQQGVAVNIIGTPGAQELRHRMGVQSEQLFDTVASDRRDDPKLRKVSADSIDHRRLLADEQVPSSVQCQATLLL